MHVGKLRFGWRTLKKLSQLHTRRHIKRDCSLFMNEIYNVKHYMHKICVKIVGQFKDRMENILFTFVFLGEICLNGKTCQTIDNTTHDSLKLILFISNFM